ncbi:general stress protein, partial [Carnobacterium jeotgali]|uniref:general stress protein n=1 Tax=Carnobacterium jeotgali TaxID=545534 RepID=UPI003C75A215
MDRRVEGTYMSKEEAVSAIERLINEGYLADEIIIVTNEKTESQLEDLTLVEVDAVDPGEGLSLWEKLKQSFSFGRYDSDEPSNPLEDYGVEEGSGDHFTEALENDEIVILVNSGGPSNLNHLSQVNEAALNGEDSSNNENGAFTPSETPTKEETEATPGDGEQFDPTKAQSSREDVAGNPVTAPDKEVSSSPIAETKDVKDSSFDNVPQLTGDESTVVSENEDHVYPSNISKGVVDGGDAAASSVHVNGAGKLEETRPDQQVEQPESDAYYSD